MNQLSKKKKEEIEERARKLAEKTIPTAHEIEIRFGPYIRPPPYRCIRTGYIEIKWNIQVMNNRFEWEHGFMNATFDIDEFMELDNKITSIALQRVKEAYYNFCMKVSGMDRMKEEYAAMLAIIYGDPNTARLFFSLQKGEEYLW